MAGESPDKTEQQKSSGTAAEERDPRFAVFRAPGADRDADKDRGTETDTHTDSDSDADTDVDAGAASDTATAVFRPRLPGDAAPREPEAESSSAAREPEAGPTAASEPEPGSGAESGTETASEPQSAPVEASTASGEPATPAAGAGAVEGRTSPETDAEAPGAEAADDSDPGPDPDPGPGPEAGDGRLRDVVAAWVDAAADDKPTAATEDDADSGTTSGAESGAESGTDAKDEPSATAEPEAERGADVGPEPEGEPDDEPKPDADPDSAMSDTARGPGSGSGAEPDSTPEPDADDTSEPRGVDQPTAIFKAIKPVESVEPVVATDRVDQATTALKLPPREDKPESKPGSPSESKSGSEPRSGDKPESEAERTSTFVPLRSDDVRPAPAPRKPEPGAEPRPDAGSPASPPPAAPSWAAAERTRQQPLPPRPPLDLLAELTNTPPPPETPVRTAVRRIKIWTPLVLLLLIVFAIVQVMRPLPEPSLELTAKPTYTFEGGETKLSWPGQGQSAVMIDGVGSLGSEGAQKPAPIASVAKVMTAHVILQEHPLKGDEEGETITVDQKAEDESKRPDESTAPLTKGQKLTQRQMLQLLMIPSGNNAARLLARWDAGSEDAFIDKMNAEAKKLGMTGSTYTDPSGLEKTTVSTATDQLKLAQAVMRNEVFRKIVDMPEIEIEGIDGKIYNNNNLLLQPGVSGIKTGSSTPAGGNLLWSANTKVDGKMLWIYGAVMGQQAGTGRVYDSLELSLQNSLKLIKDAQEAATSATVVKKGDVVGYVDNGFGGQTPVIATKNLKAVGWSGLEVELEVTENGKGIDQAAKAGSEVGMVTVGTGTGKVTAPVALQSDLTEPAFGDKLTRIG
ncbi:serine hydrolase [Streptomyces sp. NPDC020330]|uniref:serine hydrolase n=1 Tax=unclassified Streptomyces TaxID=2593676 RepID=UPI0037AF34E5